MQELLQEPTTEKPKYNDWLLSLKTKNDLAAQEEEAERLWREMKKPT